MEQFLTYFPSAFSWGNLAVLILGSAGGLFFGAMPGLSPTMAVALLVPFTFYLPADTSLILLGAVYTSAVAGGSISAILLSIPGAPSRASPRCSTGIRWPSRDGPRKPSTPFL